MCVMDSVLCNLNFVFNVSNVMVKTYVAIDRTDAFVVFRLYSLSHFQRILQFNILQYD